MTESEPADAELVTRTLAGNITAFGRLYDRYARMVRAVVSAVSLDWSSTADLTQESFLRAYQNLHRLRSPDRFGGWIAGIARQVARERKRMLGRDRLVFSGEPLEVVSQDDHEATTWNAEHLERLMSEVAELPERERLAIHAYFLEQNDVTQAAELLQLSRSGFYLLLNRALARLSAIIRSRESEEEATR